jgi:hypothetical protein
VSLASAHGSIWRRRHHGKSRELWKAAQKALREAGGEKPSFDELHRTYRELREDVACPSEPDGLEIVEHAFVVKGDGFDYTLGILILPDYDRTEVEDEDLLSPLTGNMSFR